ncbi:MAG: M28 family peptidase [Planctomycetes bacterium]|nr:M28 family peptidase [Planctomycetota bacterium]
MRNFFRVIVGSFFAFGFAHIALAAEGEEAFLSNVRQLTRSEMSEAWQGIDAKAGEAYFSPDGSQVLFMSVRDSWPYYQIYLTDQSGENVKMVSTGKGRTTCPWFHPSNDGTFIYASSHEGPDLTLEAEAAREYAQTPRDPSQRRGYSWDFDQNMDIYLAKLDGTIVKKLIGGPGYDAECSYSPDGSKILFTSDRTGDLELYTADADGSNVKRITNQEGYDGGGFFSPDGTKIVWRGDPNKNDYLQIFMCDVDGSNLRQITDNGSVNWAPYFHPSGEFMVFATSLQGHHNYEIYMIRPDGTGLTRLTYTERADVLPTFSPDGKKLLVTSQRGGSSSEVFIADFNTEAALEAIEQSAVREARTLAYGPSGFEPSLTAEITADEIEGHIAYLASDELRGRRTGEVGIELAADYVAERFSAAGLRPAGFGGSYFQFFKVSRGYRMQEGSAFEVTNSRGETRSFGAGTEFKALSWSRSATEEAELVFAGYGITAEQFGWDDYAGVDVEGKIVVVIRGLPEFTESWGRRAQNLASLRFKTANAQAHKAAGVVFVSSPYDLEKPEADNFIPNYDFGGDSGLVAAQFLLPSAYELFKFLGWDLQGLIEEIGTSETTCSVTIRGSKASVTAILEKVEVDAANVIGWIEGSDPVLKNEYVLVGGHYDHLGLGGEGSRWAEGYGEFHNGADDNASGTAGVIELAEKFALAEVKPRRSLIFMAFSGEELGLLGSKFYCENPIFPLERTRLMFNFDMIGRLSENSLSVLGGGSGEFQGVGLDVYVREFNREYGFEIGTGDLDRGSSDHASFIRAGVPAIFFFTGLHAEYHMPTDDIHLINFEGEAEVLKLASDVIQYFADQDDSPVWVEAQEDPHAQGQTAAGAGGGSGAYFGCIPDYTDNPQGMRIEDVAAGGPAAAAGMQGGDVIYKIDDTDIKNIYDFTYFLQSHAPGDKIHVYFYRDGKKMELDVELGSRGG